MTHEKRFLDYTLLALSVVLGVGSIILLVVLGSLTFTRFGWSDPEILLWDTFLSLLFFLQHSVMVRRAFKQRLSRVVPPLYHGAIYTIASGLVLAALVIFWQKSATGVYVLQGIARWVLYASALFAAFIFLLSIHALRTFDPLGIGPIRARLRGVEPHAGPFVVRGPYRWVRHPLYACVLVLFWSAPVVTLDRLLFNVLWTAWVYVATLFEERDLTREFGEVYTEYKKKVPMFVPWRGAASDA
ncbi:MAG: isoprenylcysteine carboxylmethyltransferase family protein [Bacteroidota bacterium]